MCLPGAVCADETKKEPKETEEERDRHRFSEQVTVTGAREEKALTEVTSGIDVIDEEELRRGRGEGLDGYLNRTPGVVAQPNDGGSDVKLSIRGFGARSTFGVRDVLVLVDGVPITDADGFTRLDQIDLASAERLEVVKGPASALYGNAAFGGVVNVITRRGSMTNSEIRVRGEAGELGFSKALVSVGGGSAENRLAWALHTSRFELTDFREHNDTETRRANGTLEWFPSDSTVVRTLLNMSQMRDEIPGSLNREQFESDPSQSRTFFQLFDWRRDDDRYRLGSVVEKQLGAKADFEGRLFVLTRDLDHPIFQVIDQTGLRFMGGARYGRNVGDAHRLVAGVDVDREDIDNQRFRNAFGEPAELLLELDETVETTGIYLQDEMDLRPDLTITVGARYDRITFSEVDLLDDAFDLSDERTFERASPKLGVLWQARPDVSVYASFATAFQVPTKSELTATEPGVGFNRELEPQVARHAEVGVRGTVNRRFRYTASIFRTDVDDEILPRTVVQDTTIFGNVGETRHQGVELSADVLFGDFFELGLGYGWSDNTFTDFADLDGKTIPGHPEHRGTLRLATRRAKGLNGTLSYQRVGTVFLNDENSETHRPYSTVDATLTYDLARWSVFVRGTNLTDELYASWIAVNDPAGNFFLPAPGRAITAGFDVSF